MAQDKENAGNTFDLPAGMFRSNDNEPEDFPLLVWRAEKKDGKTTVVADQVIKKFTEIDGDAFFEGDILIGKAEDVRGAKKTEQKGIVIIGDQFRWAGGRVKYLITQDALRDRVTQAVKHWEKNTPFRFTEIEDDDVTDSTDYISFEDRGGCFSSVGRQGGKQVISLAPGCSAGSAIHEIGHALGLWHEQSRSDREKFITIVLANVSSNARHNFDKHVTDGKDVGKYDFGSIMHYPATAFSINGQATIVTKNGESIGQRTGLSKGDIATIKAIYPNLNWASVGK